MCSFGGYWSILPTAFGRVFGIPSYVIVQGTDACGIPAIQYGVLRRKLAGESCRLSYCLSTGILPVGKSLVFSESSYCPELVGKQGVKHHFPNLNTPFTIIPYGFDHDFWRPDDPCRRDIDFISVMADGQFTRRDGELFLKMAGGFSDKRFVIVGDVPPDIRLPDNVKRITTISQAELKEFFQRTRFFVQLSLFEGFGCALAESMLCGCVPIVSAANEMPKIVGSAGFILENRSEEQLHDLVKKALGKENVNEFSRKARQRIIERYPIQGRQTAFNQLIDN